MLLEVSRQIFEKYSNIKFHENPSLVAELFRADGWTDGQTYDEAECRFTQFCETRLKIFFFVIKYLS